MEGIFLIPVVLPAMIGVYLLKTSFYEHRNATVLSHGKKNNPKEKHLSQLHETVIFSMGICMLANLHFMWSGSPSFTLFKFLRNLPIYFHIDPLGRVFGTIVTIVWAMAGLHSIAYMKYEHDERRFFGFFMIIYTVLMMLYYAGNLITLYFFYEMMTLTSMPLVLHNGTRESIMAALKYLFYSMCGAYFGLFGIFFLYRHCDSLVFMAGGTLSADAVSHKGILLIAIFCTLIGFGAKSGMFPLHAWLPAAHPVAPSPASAVLSGLIVKGGVFAIIRTVFYIVGADFIRGTWVQYAWMSITLLTVFMGSMMAYLEPVTKKRLAYSTVSQISYILFGLSLLNKSGFIGAMLHVCYHAMIKCGLFLTAGVFLVYTHKKKVSQLKGIGKQMPIVVGCWTFFSLALIGIPPFGGFISKWYLAVGALSAKVGIFGYLGPIVLLISALLTAGYLLPVTIHGFLPGKDVGYLHRIFVSKLMLVPLITMALLVLLGGMFPNVLINYFKNIAAILFARGGI